MKKVITLIKKRNRPYKYYNNYNKKKSFRKKYIYIRRNFYTRYRYGRKIKIFAEPGQHFLIKLDRRRFRFAKYLFRLKFKHKISNALSLKNKFFKKITFKVKQNNIFCSLTDLKRNKLLHVSSSATYGFKVSKRKLKHFYKIIVEIFFTTIKKNIKNFNNTLFKIIAPIKFRKNICKIIKTKIRQTKRSKISRRKKYNLLINITPKKCFNGCRVKKRIKKKRRLYRIYK